MNDSLTRLLDGPLSLRFFNNPSRVFVLAQSCKLRMPEPIRCRPIQKFYLRNGLGTQPDAFPHFLSRQFISPSRFVRARQIDEGHGRGDLVPDFPEDLTAWRRNEPIANPDFTTRIGGGIRTR
jgi:hypothetical protein